MKPKRYEVKFIAQYGKIDMVWVETANGPVIKAEDFDQYEREVELIRQENERLKESLSRWESHGKYLPNDGLDK
jgi:hypothetical protein